MCFEVKFYNKPLQDRTEGIHKRQVRGAQICSTDSNYSHSQTGWSVRGREDPRPDGPYSALWRWSGAYGPISRSRTGIELYVLSNGEIAVYLVIMGFSLWSKSYKLKMVRLWNIIYKMYISRFDRIIKSMVLIKMMLSLTILVLTPTSNRTRVRQRCILLYAHQTRPHCIWWTSLSKTGTRQNTLECAVDRLIKQG